MKQVNERLKAPQKGLNVRGITFFYMVICPEKIE